MAERDLPEPKPRQYSAEERRLRRQNLLITLLGFCTAYAQLHKLIIPLFLKLTPLHSNPYSHVDIWFLHSLVLFIVLKKTRKLGPFGSFLAGIGILYGIFEIYEVFLGRLVGWLAFSRLLSSVPISFCCGLLMTVKDIDRRLGYAWAGTALLALFLIPQESHYWGTKSAAQQEIPKPADLQEKRRAFIVCGANEVHWDEESQKFFNSHAPSYAIEIRDCGFYPAISRLGQTLSVSNRTDQALNLHYLAYRNGKQSASWNVVLKPRQRLTKELETAEAAIVYSDSLPGAGLSALLGETKENWIWTRSPIGVRRANEF
ncbi:MAG: hypothetical protein R3B54_14605 [Bdellovibrionota bacterium]